MQRDPSINITLSNLKKVLKQLGIAEENAHRILVAAYPYSVKDRSILKSTVKTKSKIQKNNSEFVDEKVIAEFNSILSQVRITLNHKFTTLINKKSSSYTQLAEIATIADQFCQATGENRKNGMKIFCTLGIKFMGKTYALNKFRYYSESIMNLYEAYSLIENDPNKSGTDQFHYIWKDCMRKYVNATYSVDKDPARFVHIIHGRTEADKYRADYINWITAQFEELSFINAAPELSQFHGDQALARYQKFMSKEKKKEMQASKLVTNNSKEELNYHKLLK